LSSKGDRPSWPKIAFGTVPAKAIGVLVFPKPGSFVANGFAQTRYVWEAHAHQMSSSPGLGEADAY
jgi:hypothetical protein